MRATLFDKVSIFRGPGWPGRVIVNTENTSLRSLRLTNYYVGPVPTATLREYQPNDLPDLYDVCIRTGDNGEDATGKYERPQLLGDIYVGPYVHFEPELAFVLDSGERAVGYVLGTANTEAFVRRYREEWLPLLAGRYPGPPTELVTNDDRLLDVFYHPERMLRPETAGYPAHLHIDILPPYQGAGNGRLLMEAFLDAAAGAGAEAVHLGVSLTNLRAQGFYRRLGFHEIEVAGVGRALVFGRSTAR